MLSREVIGVQNYLQDPSNPTSGWPENWNYFSKPPIGTLLSQPTRKEQAEARREKDKYQPSGPTIELPERLGTLTLAIRPVSTMALATVSSLEKSMAFFNRRKETTVQREKAQPTTLVKEITYIGTHDTIKTMTDGTATETTEPIAATTELSPAPIPTPTEFRKQEEHDTRGSAGLVPTPEKKGWFSSFGRRAAAAMATVAIIAAPVVGFIASKWNGANHIAENPQPQNAPTRTVPTSETSQGIFDKATQPVVPTTVVEQPKPTPTLAPGTGGTSIERFSSSVPNSAELNNIVDKYNNGEQLSNELLNKVNLARAEQAKKSGTEKIAHDKFQKTAEGLAYRTETEGYKDIPEVEGLNITLKEVNGEIKPTYLAKSENPYGLKEGEIAGEFYKDAFDVVDNTETAEQVGIFVGKPEVISAMLRKAGAPQNNAIIALPFDPTTASLEDKKVYVQNTATPNGSQQVVMRVPKGATFNVSSQGSSGETPFQVVNQAWGGTVIDFSSNLLGKLDAIITTADELPRVTKTAQLGTSLGTSSGNNFPQKVLDLFNRWTIKPIAGANAYLDIQQTTEYGNEVPTQLKVTKNNLLRTDQSYVSVSTNNN